MSNAQSSKAREGVVRTFVLVLDGGATLQSSSTDHDANRRFQRECEINNHFDWLWTEVYLNGELKSKKQAETPNWLNF